MIVLHLIKSNAIEDTGHDDKSSEKDYKSLNRENYLRVSTLFGEWEPGAVFSLSDPVLL